MEEQIFIKIIEAIRKDEAQNLKLYKDYEHLLSETVLDAFTTPTKNLYSAVTSSIMDHFRDEFPSLLEEHLISDMVPGKLFGLLLEKKGKQQFLDDVTLYS